MISKILSKLERLLRVCHVFYNAKQTYVILQIIRPK
uniref:Uncharacterized protein n=1 Tax=Rhizophora mucronata TaxID=61149 RepID=A0A2P2NBA0_RHIMU